MRDVAKYILIVFVLCSCNQEKSSSKTVEIHNYSIDVPANWTTFKYDGIDSSVQGLITNNGDTIYSSFNKSAMSFDETVQVFSKAQIAKYDSLGLDTKSLYYSENPSIDESQGTFLKEFYYYDTISGFKAKIIQPKKIGNGLTGISIKGFDSESNRLTLYSRGLDTINQFKLLKSIKTIKIN